MDNKKEFVILMEKMLKEKWDSEKLKFVVEEDNGDANYEFILTDLTFGSIYNEEHITEYERYVFTFLYNNEETKVDFLLKVDEVYDEDLDEYFGSVEVETVLPHNMYKLYENSETTSDVIFLKNSADYRRTSELCKVLNYLDFGIILYNYRELLWDVRYRDELVHDKQFFEKYKDGLLGIKKIENTLLNNVSVTLDSGMIFEIEKSNLIHQAKTIARLNSEINKI